MKHSGEYSNGVAKWKRSQWMVMKTSCFFNLNGLPKTTNNYNAIIKELVRKCNKFHMEQLPNIIPYTFRHDFCPRIDNAGMNPYIAIHHRLF